jgi:hypothetical protein
LIYYLPKVYLSSYYLGSDPGWNSPMRVYLPESLSW